MVAGLGRDLSLGGAVSLGLTLREERPSLLGTSTVPRAGQGRRLQVSLDGFGVGGGAMGDGAETLTGLSNQA